MLWKVDKENRKRRRKNHQDTKRIARHRRVIIIISVSTMATLHLYIQTRIENVLGLSNNGNNHDDNGIRVAHIQ